MIHTWNTNMQKSTYDHDKINGLGESWFYSHLLSGGSCYVGSITSITSIHSK